MSMGTSTMNLRPARKSAVAAAAGFLVIAVFQLSLAAGAPLGRAAWGGTHAHLPVGLRVGSAFAAAVWVLAALIVLGRAEFRISPLPAVFVRRGMWILVGLQPLAAIVNFASPSGWERFVWGPVALVQMVLCLVVARSRPPVAGADRASALAVRPEDPRGSGSAAGSF
jgi:hypothetical protein